MQKKPENKNNFKKIQTPFIHLPSSSIQLADKQLQNAHLLSRNPAEVAYT